MMQEFPSQKLTYLFAMRVVHTISNLSHELQILHEVLEKIPQSVQQLLLIDSCI